MKKLLALLISFILIFAISVPTFAAGTATFAITSDNEVIRGKTVKFTVSLSDCEPVSTISFKLLYDKSIFHDIKEFKNDENTKFMNWLLTDGISPACDYDAGNATIAYLPAKTVSGNVFEFVLKVNDVEMDCIRFGKGKKTLIMIQGLNTNGIKGSGIMLSLMYHIFSKRI